MIIIASAAVGLVIGALEIYERMPGVSDTGLSQQSLGQSAKTAAPSAPSEPAPTETVPQMAERAEAVELSEETTKFTTRVIALLQDMGCRQFSLTDVDIVQKFTPASETTSGFDASYVDGAARLLIGLDQAGTAVGSFYRDVKGTGKGPRAEGAAYDMAARSLLQGLADEVEFKQFCKGLD